MGKCGGGGCRLISIRANLSRRVAKERSQQENEVTCGGCHNKIVTVAHKK